MSEDIDIVKRLRQPCGRTIGHGESCVQGWLCRECSEKAKAADEIERLQSEAWAAPKLRERIKDLEGEIERLRLALLAISNYPHGGTEAQLMRVYARTTLHWRVE